MKTNKIKPQKKAAKKAVQKHIEQSLTEKFLETVKGLGHNAELIAGDIAKLSKSAAKKLSKKFQEVKTVVEHKIEDVKASNKKSAINKVKLAKKDASKLMKKVDKSVTKVVKKAVKKAKPVATSVKVEGLATEQKAKAAIRPVVKTNTTKAMANKSSASSAKKAVVKAVTNNPVKKVAVKAIPTKKNTTTKK
jgi:L-fucose mutarotase/ribose pyranase (RbsD/FucU family)